MSAGEWQQYYDQFQRRIIQDAIQEATRTYWLRRAAQFEAARPWPGTRAGREDFRGNASLEDMRQRWRDLTEIANACRAKAQMALIEDVPEVDEWFDDRGVA